MRATTLVRAATALCFTVGVAAALRTPGISAPHPTRGTSTRRAFFGSAAALACTPAAALATPDEPDERARAEEPTDAGTAAVGSAVAAKGWAPTAAPGTAAAARAEEPTEPRKFLTDDPDVSPSGRKYDNWLDGYAYKPGTPISAYLKQTYGLRTSEEILAPTLQRYADGKPNPSP